MNKIIDSWFFSSFKNTIGVVKIKDAFGNEKFYIDVVEGLDQEIDEEAIAKWGTPFYPEKIK